LSESRKSGLVVSEPVFGSDPDPSGIDVDLFLDLDTGQNNALNPVIIVAFILFLLISA
jgi:hypothetical protein